jgi:quercetin dioxygenase-like cupin family protein
MASPSDSGNLTGRRAEGVYILAARALRWRTKMSNLSSWTFFAMAGFCGVAAVTLHARMDAAAGEAASPNSTPTRLTRIYSGPDGQSHAEDIDVKFGAPDALGLAQSEAQKASSTNFVRFAPNFVEDWHHAHARRYVITLSGKGEIDLSDGHKVTLEPGHILLTDDLTGKGHIARAVTADWTAAFVQLEEGEQP